MKINGDLLVNTKVDGTIYANDFQCKNLLDESKISSSAKSVGIKYDGSKVYSTNTSSDNRAWNYANANYYITLEAGTYTLSLNFLRKITNSSGGLFRFFKEDDTFIGNVNAYNVDKASVTITLTAITKLGLYFKLYDGQVNIQIESGDTSTKYIPFTYINENVDNAFNVLETSINSKVPVLSKKYFSSIQQNGGYIEYSYNQITNGEIGIYLISVVGTHPGWSSVGILTGWSDNGLQSVTTLRESNFKFSIVSNKLRITNSNNSYSMDGQLMVIKIGDRY